MAKRKATALARREIVSVAPSVTIEPTEAVNEWLAEHRSENTRMAYYRDLLDFCRTILKSKDIKVALGKFFAMNEVEAGIKLTQFKQALRERGATPATINRKLSALRAFIDHARRRGIVNWRISDLIKGEKQRTDPKERIRSHLPAVTIDGLVEAMQRLFSVLPKKGVRGLRDRAIVVLMALHGLRRVEVVRLSFSDIIDEPDGVFALRVWGKGDKHRIVKLRPDTTELIQRYVASLKRSGIKPVSDAFGEPLFVSLRKGKGKRLTLQQVNNIVDEALKEAGIKRQGISCHSLRHAFGTLAATKRGVPIPDLAAYLGHTNIATTSLYAHAVGVVNPSAMIKEIRAL